MHLPLQRCSSVSVRRSDMNTPHSPQLASPAPRPRPAVVPPLGDLSSLLPPARRQPVRPTQTQQGRPAIIPAGRLHAVDPKPRSTVLSLPYEVGGAQPAIVAAARAINGQAADLKAKAGAQVGDKRSAGKRVTGSTVRSSLSSLSSSPTERSADSRSSARTAPPSPAADVLVVRPAPRPASAAAASSAAAPLAGRPSSSSSAASAGAVTSLLSQPAAGARVLTSAVSSVPSAQSFRSSGRRSSTQPQRLQYSAAFRGLTPRAAAAASHRPDTDWLDGCVQCTGKGGAGSKRAEESKEMTQDVEETGEKGRAVMRVVRTAVTPSRAPLLPSSSSASSPPPPSSSTAAAVLGVEPEEFLELVQSDPTRAFQLIFPDYRPRDSGDGAERSSGSRGSSSDRQRRDRPKPAAAVSVGRQQQQQQQQPAVQQEESKVQAAWSEHKSQLSIDRSMRRSEGSRDNQKQRSETVSQPARQSETKGKTVRGVTRQDDEEEAEAKTASRDASSPAVALQHQTMAFSTHFALDGKKEEEEEADHEEQETRAMVRQFVQEAQRRHQPRVAASTDDVQQEEQHTASAAHPPQRRSAGGDENEVEEEIEGTASADDEQQEEEAEADNSGAGHPLTAVTISPPSTPASPQRAPSSPISRKRPTALLSPVTSRPPSASTHSASSDSFTIAASAPSSPALHIAESNSDDEEFTL